MNGGRILKELKINVTSPSLVCCYHLNCSMKAIPTRVIVHPAINVHFDILCLNKHCGETLCPRDFKLSARDHNSYGFIPIGFVSMETLLPFEPTLFVKITKILTSPMVKIFFNVLYFFLEPT